MKQQDPTLQYWSDRIDSLSAEYERAKTNTSYIKNDLDSAWESLRSLQEEYRSYKEQADYEFQQASYCWDMHDGASAKEHSANGHNLNDRKSMLGSSLDSAHAHHDAVRSRFNESVSYQRSVKADLDIAKSAHKSRIEELKELHFQESMHWHDKSCAKCGLNIRYNDTWTHTPKYCKNCWEILERERKEREEKRAAENAHWHEKSCKECDKTIRYLDDWSNIPNYCRDCKAKFEINRKEREARRREKEAQRHEKACRGCGNTIIYYDYWEHIPNYCKECQEKGSVWSTQTKASQPQSGYRLFDYSHDIRKQNSKDLSCFLQAHFGKSCNIKMDNLACPKRTMLQPDPPADHARVIPLQTGFYYSR